MGTSAMGMLAIDARSWKSAEWAAQQGLYAEVFDSAEAMDVAVDRLAAELASSNPDAMANLKRVLWEGTEHWDTLLMPNGSVRTSCAERFYARRHRGLQSLTAPLYIKKNPSLSAGVFGFGPLRQSLFIRMSCLPINAE